MNPQCGHTEDTLSLFLRTFFGTDGISMFGTPRSRSDAAESPAIRRPEQPATLRNANGGAPGYRPPRPSVRPSGARTTSGCRIATLFGVTSDLPTNVAPSSMMSRVAFRSP